ncbi:MAG: zeta toxin family protein, partial [Waterburya sp.]
VNADIIAAQLNPNDVDAAAIAASRMMLNRLNVLASQEVDFAFETTLAARSFARFLKKCKTEGYKINLIYVWLESSDLAVQRVSRRVASGGHDIPNDIIRRRYQRGLLNFFELYSPLADYWIVYNNSQSPTQEIAEKAINSSAIIYQPHIWQQIIQKHHES